MASLKLPIYLDNAATTPVDPRVVEKMLPWLGGQFGNPASTTHVFGQAASRAVETAREQVAALIGAEPREIIWTSGATESDNLAIKGAAYACWERGRHIVTIQTEHKAVLDTVRELERRGFTATYLAPEPNGLVDPEKFRAALRPDTIVASVMLVNNEIGVIQDIATLGAMCHEHGILFHVDAAQATGKIPIDLKRLPVDLMSLTAHKTYGPKGIGALYVRRDPRVRPLEAAVRRGQAVVRACLELKKQGFVPDIVYAHPGWGEALFLRDLYPDARITLYCEFFYRARGADVGFDPEFPSSLDDIFRVRVKNAASLLSLEAADAGLAPTVWQRKCFPREYRSRIEVIHEGVDTDVLRPDPGADLILAEGKPRLTARDEVVTYVARNLEPYRGFHIFMRAIPEIQKRRPRAHVVIIGDTGVSYGQALPDRRTYKQQMLDEVGAKLDMSRVHFLGPVSYETLLCAYRVSSAHVYLTYPFVLSWSMLEAMSAGCAVVASRTPPVTEVIEDRRNGFLVDFFSPSEIAERVDEVLEGGPAVAAVREQARRTIVARYDLRRVCLPAHLKLLGVTSLAPAARSGDARV